MEIEAPAHAIAIWTEGDSIMVRFPDRQLVSVASTQQLMIILRHREKSAMNGRRMTVGTKAAPVQYDIDAISEALKRKQTLAVNDTGEKTRERERARLLRLDAKMQRDKAAKRELRELNLL